MSTPQQPHQGDPNQQPQNGQPQERVVYVEKKKKGGCMKWGAIIVVALIVIAILAAVFSGGDEDSDSPNGGAQNSEAAEGLEEQTEFQPGQTYTTGDGLDLTVTAFRTSSDPMGTQLSCADITYTNNGEEQASFQGYWDWKMQNPAGVITDPALTGENSLDSGELAPGGSVSGSVCFEGAEPGEYRLVYEPTLSFTSDTATWIGNL